MKLTLKEVDDLLQAEIIWCLDNPDRELTHDQQMGFMNGLRQAQTIIRRAEEAVQPVRYWQHDETGRLCATPLRPSERWYEITVHQYIRATTRRVSLDDTLGVDGLDS